jgi:hypothetical protein
MLYLHAKNPNFGKFWKASKRKILVSLPNGHLVFYGHLAHYVLIWYSSWSFGIFFPVSAWPGIASSMVGFSAGMKILFVHI